MSSVTDHTPIAVLTHVRPARQADSRDIARLFLMSSDGLAAYIWSRVERTEGDPLKVGTARYARKDTEFSYQNCLVVDSHLGVIGMYHAFPMTGSDGPIESDPVLRPYAELEDPGSYYISGLAIEPYYRRMGLGRMLMDLAETRAAKLGFDRVSLICFDQNRAAKKLYSNRGYETVDHRAVVPHPSLWHTEGHALLMVKKLRTESGLT